MPRPISSRMTSEREVARLRMAAVSTISTMKVERPWAMSSLAPTREKTRSTTPIWALSAGTKLPVWARMAISAFWRRKVDLPPMLGPVTSQSAPPDRSVSLATKGWPSALHIGFDHRMAAAGDGEGEAVVDDGPAEIAGRGEVSEAGGDVEFSERIGERRGAVRFRPASPRRAGRRWRSRGPAPASCALAMRPSSSVSSRGRKAHGVGHGLAMDEAVAVRRSSSSLAPCPAGTSTK